MKISFRLWISSALIFTFLFIIGMENEKLSIDYIGFYLVILLATLLVSLPVLGIHILYFSGHFQKRKENLYVQFSYVEILSIDAFLIAIYTSAIYLFIGEAIPFKHVTIFLILSELIAIVLNTSHLNTIVHTPIPTISEIISIIYPTIKFKTMNQSHPEETFQNESKFSSKITIKLIIVAALTLLLLIPTFMIENLITERKERSESITKEVTSKWASEQTITSPYLAIPYTNKSDKNAIVHYINIPSEQLSINGQLSPEIRHRSIFSVLLYTSKIKLSGNFILSLEELQKDKNIQLENAFLCMGITDFKGIKSNINASFNDQKILFTKKMPNQYINTYGLSAPLTISAANNSSHFSIDLDINGSSSIKFLPISQNADISLRSNWPYPSSIGNILPANTTTTEKGFDVNWKLSPLNSPFGKTIESNVANLSAASFGIQVVSPSDNYTNTLRCIKYSILLIGLTFTIIFLLEITQNNSMHPIQYLFIGLALCIFYTLLLSFAEFSDFIVAYSIASVATILLITFYAKSQFKAWKIAYGFGSLICMLFAFMYILVNLEDTALIVGSISLFVILAIIMYATRKINWNNPLQNKVIRNAVA